MEHLIDPVRLCCGRLGSEHLGPNGVVCPDKKVMCCICFGRFTIAELYTDPDGSKSDVCHECGMHECMVVAHLINYDLSRNHDHPST